MTEQKDHSEKVKEALRTISLLIIGLGVGWLAGLSVSPVATILISGLLGVAIAIVGIISISLTYRDDQDKTIRSVGFKAAEKISIGSLALIVFGIALGVSIGIWVRTHNVLGVISVEKQDNSFTKLQGELTQLKEQEGTGEQKGKWKDLDIPLSDIAQRILDKHYPKGNSANRLAATAKAENKINFGGLMSTKAASDCNELLSRPISNWRSYIQMIDNNLFIGLNEIADDSELEKKVHSICEQFGQLSE